MSKENGKCHVCGVGGEVFGIDCQPGGASGRDPGVWKRVDMCSRCWDRLDPDMWTCQEHYEELSPATPYEKLPDLHPLPEPPDEPKQPPAAL